MQQGGVKKQRKVILADQNGMIDIEMHVCAGLLKYAAAESWNFLVCLIKLVKVEILTCIQDIQSYYETGLSARWLVQTNIIRPQPLQLNGHKVILHFSNWANVISVILFDLYPNVYTKTAQKIQKSFRKSETFHEISKSGGQKYCQKLDHIW